MKNTNGKNALIVVSGMSPAVITETVWALAVQSPPVIPDKIIVLTTQDGKARLMEKLQFDNGAPGTRGPWGALRRALEEMGLNVNGRLILTDQTVKVFVGADERPLNDLRTRTENLLAANLMMKEIREFTDDEGWIVHAQLAGGRKTMSALFFSCMCLLGRPRDHVYHVLVSDGYDNPQLSPSFLFPQRGVVHEGTDKDGKIRHLPSIKAKIDLFDVPFVPMGEWAEQKCKGARKNLSYESMIAAVSKSVDAETRPKVTVDFAGKGHILIGDEARVIKPTACEFVLFVMLLQGFGITGALERIFGMKDDIAAREDEWSSLRRTAKKSPCTWLSNFLWETSRQTSNGGEYEAPRIPAVMYHEDEKLQRMDFNRAKSNFKKRFEEIAAARLLELFEQPSDGALGKVFNYDAVSWLHVESVPEFIRDYILPDDAPFPVAAAKRG